MVDIVDVSRVALRNEFEESDLEFQELSELDLKSLLFDNLVNILLE